MRLSEIVVIYLAAAAPFGVAYYLQRETSISRIHVLALAAGAALAWPVRLIVTVFAHKRLATKQEIAAEGAVYLSRNQKLEITKRALLMALCEIEEATKATFGTMSKRAEHTIFAARECVERYVGLSLAASEAEIDDPPSAREMEMPRIAGLEGEDLLIAGRCAHRHNVARLIAHQDRARTELLQRLAEAREIPDGRYSLPQPNPYAARGLSEAILQAYGHAIELLSMLDDHRATMVVARLLDAECARLRSMDSSSHRHTPECADEGAPCATPLPPSTSSITHVPQKPIAGARWYD